MAHDIEVAALTTFEVAPDGAVLRMKMKDVHGAEAALTLPLSCLNQLIMTLPRMAQQALKAQFRDDSLKFVFPADGWQLEQATDLKSYILTFGTPDGFEASFSLSRTQIDALADTLATGDRHQREARWSN